MTESLTRVEYIWAVTIESPDDGHRITVAHFTDMNDAVRLARERGGNYVQTTLYRDGQGDYWKVSMKQVDVDIPDRNEVLGKLTKAEKRALGIKP